MLGRKPSTLQRNNTPTLVLCPTSPSVNELKSLSLSSALAKDGVTVVGADSDAQPAPFSWQLSPDKTQDNAKLSSSAPLGSPSLTPRAGSVWAAQTLSANYSASRSASGSYYWSLSGSFSPGGSGLRTPSGFEHLDFGADYFDTFGSSKRIPRSFEWEYWSSDDTRSFSPPTPALSPSPPSSPASSRRVASSTSTSEEAVDSPTPSQDSFHTGDVIKRRLGPNETSYYLGSRGAGPTDPESGVNDMYLHIGFKAPTCLVTPDRVAKIWTELRLRHTLLTSSVEYEGFEDIRFLFNPVTSYSEAYEAARENLEFRYGVTKDQVLNDYLNGHRSLSDRKLAALWISTEMAQSDLAASGEQNVAEYHFWLMATHFLGDGMALHTTANEFFTLLGGGLEEAEASASGLEWDTKTGQIAVPRLSRLPPAQETRISTPEGYGRLAWAAARIEFSKSQARTIGGQTFPRAKLGPRQTVVPTVSFSKEETGKILKACKAHGVTIAHAMFALANLAKIKVTRDAISTDQEWGSAASKDETMPMMLYSALNLRPNMVKGPEEDQGVKPDFFHLVIGYYNIMLPSFALSGRSLADTFWHRARTTKDQTVKAVKTPWLTQRSKLMSLERERRAIGFEKEDERRRRAKAAKEAGLPSNIGLGRPSAPPAKPAEVEEKKTPAAPSLAFLGVSMLGNLDGMYKHAAFPKIQLESLTTGSRQRPGAMLLFAYTFAGKLWYSLGYDANAYPAGSVEAFYQAMQDYTREFMVNSA